MTRSENGPLAQIMLALRPIFHRLDVQALFDQMEGRP